MAYVGSTFTFGSSGRGAFAGGMYRISLDWTAKRMYLPPSASAIEAIPSSATYLQRLYLVGQHTQNLLIDEELRVVRQGIVPPPQPQVSAGAGAIQQRCYLRWYDEITNERSSIGLGKDITGNTTRTWANLPTEVSSEVLVMEGVVVIAAGVVVAAGNQGITNFGVLRPGDRIAISTDLTTWTQVRSIISDAEMTIDDVAMAGVSVTIVVKPVSRVSHIEEWIAVGGGLPRFGTRLRIGTTGNTESIATLALGEALIDSYQPMPTGNINLVYNDRQFVAGVQGRLNRVFLSEIGFLERYAGLNFTTAYGEPIVGLFRYRDYIIILCPASSYRLQGYTEDDYVRSVLEPDIGGLGHLGNRIAKGIGYIPGKHGIQTFNGAFHDATPTRESEWIDDYRDNAIAFEGGFGVINSNDKNYFFIPNVQRLAVSSDEAAVTPSLVCAEVSLTTPTTINSEKLYIVGHSVFFPGGPGTFPDIDAEQGVVFGWFGNDQTPNLRLTRTVGFDILDPYRNITLTIGVNGSTAYTWGYDADDLGAIDDVVLKSFTQGSDPVEVARIAFPNAYPVSIAVLAGDLFVSVGDPLTTDQRVYKLVAGSLVLDDTQALVGMPLLAAMGADLYAVYGTNATAPSTIRRRVAGVWSTLVLPNPPITFGASTYPVEYSSALWCFGDSTTTVEIQVLKVVGLTVTRERSVVGSNTASDAILYPTVFDGFLYYVFRTSVGLWIGRFDGVTWDDTFKDMLAQFNIGLTKIIGLAVFDGALRLLAQDDDAVFPCTFNFFSSNGTDVGGAWAREEAGHVGFYADTAYTDSVSQQQAQRLVVL